MALLETIAACRCRLSCISVLWMRLCRPHSTVKGFPTWPDMDRWQLRFPPSLVWSRLQHHCRKRLPYRPTRSAICTIRRLAENFEPKAPTWGRPRWDRAMNCRANGSCILSACRSRECYRPVYLELELMRRMIGTTGSSSVKRRISYPPAFMIC